MDCKRTDALLIDFLYGELDPDAHAAFERHLAECPACAEQVQALKGVLQLVRAQPKLEPSEEVVRRILHAARAGVTHAEDQRRRQPPAVWLRWIWNPAIISTVGILVVLSVALGTHLGSQDSDESGIARSIPPIQPPAAPAPPAEDDAGAGPGRPAADAQAAQEAIATPSRKKASGRGGQSAKPAAGRVLARTDAVEGISIDKAERREDKIQTLHQAQAADLALSEKAGREQEPVETKAGLTEEIIIGERNASAPADGDFADFAAEPLADERAKVTHDKRARIAKSLPQKAPSRPVAKSKPRASPADPKPRRRMQPAPAVEESRSRFRPTAAADAMDGESPALGTKVDKPTASRELAKSERAVAEPGAASGDLYAQAKRALARGEYRRAASAFGAFLAKHPADPRCASARYGLAKAWFLAGRCEAAISSAQRAYNASPRHAMAAEILFDQASCYIKLGRFQQAIGIYRRVEQNFPAQRSKARRAIERISPPVSAPAEAERR